MRRRVINRSALGGLLILVLLLSSCIKYEGTIKINDDGSGTVNILTAIDPSAFEALGELGGEAGEFDDICQEFNSDVNAEEDLPDGASVQPYNEDGFCGARIQSPLAASDDHSAALEDFLDQTTRLYKEGDNWFFETNFNAEEITGEADDFGEEFANDLFGDASFQITVDLPGKALDGANNATQVGSDGVFRWDIDLLNPPGRLFAQTEPGSGGGDGSSISTEGSGSSSDGGGGLSKVLIALVVLALLGGVGFFLWNKRKNESAGDAVDPLMQPGVVGDPMAANPMAANPLSADSMAPGGATMPVTTGPAISATPPADAMRETVVLSAAGVADAVADTTAAPQPVFDEQLQAWVVDDPTRGRLRHDPATDSWSPI